MMNERERAAYYQRHKDDPNIWGEPEAQERPRPRGTLGATITVRFAPGEAHRIRETAKRLKLSYSEVVRRAVESFTRSVLDPDPPTSDLPPVGGQEIAAPRTKLSGRLFEPQAFSASAGRGSVAAASEDG